MPTQEELMAARKAKSDHSDKAMLRAVIETLRERSPNDAAAAELRLAELEGREPEAWALGPPAS